MLLEGGSDLEESEPDTQFTALHYAAITGHIALLELLISHKADLNSRDKIKATSLHMASQEGHLPFVVTLLQAGADPLLPKDSGSVPIHRAAQGNHPEVAKILVEQGRCSPDQVRHYFHDFVTYDLRPLNHLHIGSTVRLPHAPTNYSLQPLHQVHDHWIQWAAGDEVPAQVRLRAAQEVHV